MPALTDRTIDTTIARASAADWHGGQGSALYAFASSGHVSGAAYREAWHAYRERAPWSRRLNAESLTDRRDLVALIRWLRVNAFYTIDVCEDCYRVHHFGWATRTLPATLECVAAYLALGGDQYVTDATDSETGEGLTEFSWSACECCHSTLGGARYALTVERY